ncbi:RpiB/LacA/LacB family sugar-phosphate isomerase [Microbacterium horticulturae]|uniref:RpiB/LacA/LacB family sugar-phosphate isomerase n=1 Tax=Microbacterium horticulturae TaxID=3028316 RepID=A0ABY8BY78_9MICO|nr:RpiB/LacA/LacB family sugar-phosphate isomerase [Microbacterium sp. KACC 23027]WEG08462.1 RpiB/LacA/LacB family sugar-phosphate isomerase [Microbacterium sp. KACC 23027]
MTRIHFAVDHGGYELGRALEQRATDGRFEVVWHGADELDPGDDYPVYAIAVAQAVVKDQDAGIDAFAVLVVDEALAGVVAANKVNGARAVTTTSPRAAATARAVVDANVLVIDGVAFEESAWLNIYAFVSSGMDQTVERGRQILQIEEYENAGTIEGWAVQLEPEQILRTY